MSSPSPLGAADFVSESPAGGSQKGAFPVLAFSPDLLSDLARARREGLCEVSHMSPRASQNVLSGLRLRQTAPCWPIWFPRGEAQLPGHALSGDCSSTCPLTGSPVDAEQVCLTPSHRSAVAAEGVPILRCSFCCRRAALMDGLMKVGMRNRLERQHFAMNILLSTYGADLTALKVPFLLPHCWPLCSSCPICRYGLPVSEEGLQKKIVVGRLLRRGSSTMAGTTTFCTSSCTTTCKAGIRCCIPGHSLRLRLADALSACW